MPFKFILAWGKTSHYFWGFLRLSHGQVSDRLGSTSGLLGQGLVLHLDGINLRGDFGEDLEASLEVGQHGGHQVSQGGEGLGLLERKPWRK